mmetsp:Transcript_28659/g.75580  ORF Transcript_28659/g.75580 Transcript_28659/m.75580 type:complete len:99 (+) Transcript_28659:2-298(+)
MPMQQVTGVDMNRNGIPDVLEQNRGFGPQPSMQTMMAGPGPMGGVPMQTMQVTGVDMNRDGIPDVLQQGMQGMPVTAYGDMNMMGAMPTMQTMMVPHY